MTGTATTVAIIAIMNRLQDPAPPKKMETALYVNLGIFAVAAVILLAFNGSYKRFAHEQRKKYESVNN